MAFFVKKKSIDLKNIEHKIIIIIALFTICIGILLRFNNLDGKIYWLDESFTSLSVSAYSRGDVKQQLITGKEIDIPTIKQYQFPNDLVNYQGTIQGLIEDEPQHTPVYFLTARFWLQAFGNSILTIRILSVVAGILCLPLMYLLCNELFNQPIVSWIATAFMAVSPFHILYSQEARPFSLWTLTTLLSCVALLKVQKKPSFPGWLLYSFSIIISCYTFLFSLLTYLAHFIYILLSEKFRINKTTIYCCFAGLLILLGFSPWIVILKNNPPSNYTSFPASSLLAYPKAWVRNLSLPFVDFNINESSSLEVLIPFFIYLLILLAIFAYSFFYLSNNSNKKSFFFLASLLIIPSLVLLLRDFGRGGQMTLRANYLIPSLLSIQVMFAYLLGNNILKNTNKNRVFWLSLTSIFLSLAIASCFLMTSSNVWWNKGQENIHHKLAKIINQSERPLIISDVLTDDEYIRPFAVSHYLKEATKFILLFEPTEGERWQNLIIPDGYSDIFLYAPSESLKTNLVKNYGYNLIPLFDPSDLYCDCPDEVFFKLESNQN